MERTKEGEEEEITFQMMSDLHVEFPLTLNNLPNFEVKSKYIFLLGDIGNPKKETYFDFLRNMSNKYEKVFLLVGNHEFYHSEYFSVKQQISNFSSSLPNIEFLDRRSVLIGNIRIIGATLWSKIREESEDRVMKHFNDYKAISINESLLHPSLNNNNNNYNDNLNNSINNNNNINEENNLNNNNNNLNNNNNNENNKIRKLRIEDTNQFFNEDKEFIEKEILLAKKEGQKVIIITHHSPYKIGTSNPKFEVKGSNGEESDGWSTDCSDLFADPVLFWGFGHTHYSSDQVIKGVRVASNQLGYLMLHEKETGFRPNLLVRINLSNFLLSISS